MEIKEFVNKALEKQLRELGCLEVFQTVIQEERHYVDSGGNYTDESYFKKVTYKGILWQQAFDWFRRRYNLHGFNSPLLNKDWSIVIDNTLDSNQVFWGKVKGYEEAREECLKKLIELCKKK